MKKLILAMAFVLSLFLFSSCSIMDETYAKEVVIQLMEHIEQDDYESASALFCADNDEGKTLSEFLNETEEKTGLDFQSGIEIKQYVDYWSIHSDSYFGVPCAGFEIDAAIDGQSVVLYIDIVATVRGYECYDFILEFENESHQYLCHYID